MEDEDEIDVLGEFNLEHLLTKNEEQMASCYDGEHQLGLNCDSSWMLDSTQSCWYNSKSEPQPSLEEFSTSHSPEAADSNTWSDKERYLLEKGLELFGKSYSRLAQYIGTKTSSQVKSYMNCHKPIGFGWSGKSSVSTSSVGVDGMDFNFTEIIDDMEIPASMEEVIAVVSTAQPTVIVPSSYREPSSVPNTSLTRKKCRRRKHSRSGSKRDQVPFANSKEAARIYKAEEIKGVLTGNKEKDSIVLPTGEQVIRMRHGSCLSEESEVDIDVNSEPDTKVNLIKGNLTENDDSQPLTGETVDPHTESSEETKEELFEFQEDAIIDFSDIKDQLFVPHIENEVSVVTEGYIEAEPQVSEIEKDTQVFKGNLVTPSGKVMTVVVDDLHFTATLDAPHDPPPPPSPPPPPPVTSHGRKEHDVLLDAVYNLPIPTHELVVQPHIVTREEQIFHPEFFDKNFHGLKRYMKIRNHIVECWKNSKPNYVSNTAVLVSPTFTIDNSEEVILINRIHAYLERKGCINFGCDQCEYNQTSGDSNVLIEDYSDQVCSIVEVDSSSPTENVAAEYTVPMAEYVVPVTEYTELSVEKGKRGGGRARKKKITFEDICEKTTKTTPKVKKPGLKNKTSRKTQSSRLSPVWRPPKSINNNTKGGYTMVHTASGEVIVQHNQVRQPNKVHTRGIRPVRLIHCKNYTVSKKAPYKVELEVLVLLSVDIHSHLSPKCEVIGLLGGTHRMSDNVLMITMAVPCRTVLSSNIHCDMCPVSQCESSEMITSRGLSVVGWYHSHPNFDPSPSDTDVDTQNTLQSWFNDSGQPFVGLIISPYFPSLDFSYFRCCQVETESKGPVPYQLDVKLINLFGNNGLSLKQPIEAAFKTLQTYEPIRQLNVHKCLESAKHHLRKAVPKLEEEKVSQVIKEIRECIKDGFTLLVRKK